MVELDLATESGSSMESAKVLVHTVHMPFIEDNLCLSVEGGCLKFI